MRHNRSDAFREEFYPESRGRGFTSVDGTLAFYERVRRLIPAGGVVLDVGCGRGAGVTDDPVAERRIARDLRSVASAVIGIDVDPGAVVNPAISEFRLLEAGRWPVDSASVDLCLADYVLEHVADPKGFVGEAHRVLKPGAWFCFRTPNVRSYFGILSRLTPRRLHKGVVKKTSDSRAGEDVFPTYYRFNSRAKVDAVLRGMGFDAEIVGYEAEPSYLAFSKLAYRLGVLHQKHAPERWKLNLFVFARKR